MNKLVWDRYFSDYLIATISKLTGGSISGQPVMGGMLVILTLFVFSGHPVAGGRILLAGVQVASHLIELQEIGEALVRRGHDVYLAVEEGFPNRESLVKRGIKAITFESVNNDISKFRSDEFNGAMMLGITGWEGQPRSKIMEATMQDCSNMMLDEVFMSKVTALNFDLVLYDNFILSPCNVILPHRLSIPAVSVGSVLVAWDARVPSNPAVTPSKLVAYSDRMTFTQRFVNLAFHLFMSTYRVYDGNTTLLERFAPGFDSWLDLQQQTSVLYIVTRDYILEWPEAQMPNVIHIPGVTTHPAGELPRQLKDAMDAATRGAIVVSFGSITGQFPAEIIDKFLAAFSQLDQTVFFKYGGGNAEMPSDVPSNVHLLPWLPQNDLVGHPNTVLFITHCGNNGQYESLYHGVPMIGFPLFGDQSHNAHRVEVHGYGIKMDIRTFTADELVNNIHRVLDDESFKMATQKASAILKSRPMTAQDTAAYWVEHVLKFGGDHLRTSAMDMPLYQFLMLDIIIFVLVVSFLACYAIKTIFTVVCRKCLGRQTKQKQP